MGSERVAVGLSGGVDSAVAAWKLMRQGLDVVGVSMLTVPGVQDHLESAGRVAESLGIELVVADLSGDFERLVLEPFRRDYQAGRTPNPCALCNPTVKFGALVDWAAAELGAGLFATGHYARLQEGQGGHRMLRGLDLRKEQSYFLFGVEPRRLARIRFPLGDMHKTEVKAIAVREKLGVAERAESQELCFAPAGHAAFLEERFGAGEPGPICLEDGQVLGEHRGLHRYTIGQRQGLGVAWRHPLFVLAILPEENRLVVGPRLRLASSRVEAGRPVWHEPPPPPGERLLVRVRYRSKPVECQVIQADEQGFALELGEPVDAVTPGQAAVLYREDLVVGGGWILQKGGNP